MIKRVLIRGLVCLAGNSDLLRHKIMFRNRRKPSLEEHLLKSTSLVSTQCDVSASVKSQECFDIVPAP